MLVGPPGVLKTNFLETTYKEYPSSLILSDLNVNSVMALRESLLSGRYKTIVFPEYEKLYQRKQDTAANVEGTIKQLIEEGFTKASFEEQDAITFKSRALVVGAITNTFYQRKIQSWREGGFKRRFLWVAITLSDPDEIMKAIRDDRRLALDGIRRKHPISDIPMDVTPEEAKQLENMLRSQWEATPYVLMKKIFAYLKWKYRDDPRQPMKLMREFSEAIQLQYAKIEIPKQDKMEVKKK